VGIPLTLLSSRFLASQLFGVSRYDPAILSIAALALVFPALIAALIPALRASSISPIVALRPSKFQEGEYVQSQEPRSIGFLRGTARAPRIGDRPPSRRRLSEDEAFHQAHRSLGNLTTAGERFYESRRWMWLDRLTKSTGYALRQMKSSPGLQRQ